MDADGRGNLFWNTHYHVSYSHGITGSLLEGFMNKLHIKIAAFILGLHSALLAADIYTLDDCLRIARENNATLKSAKVNRQMAEETEGSEE